MVDDRSSENGKDPPALAPSLDYRRDFVLPLARMIGLAVAAVAIVLVWLSIQADSRELSAESKTAQVAINVHVAEMRRYLKDCAAWDVSVQNLVLKLNLAWANENIGPYLYKSQGYESSFVVDERGRTTYASYDERLVRLDALAYLGDPIRIALRQLRASASTQDARVSGLTKTASGHIAAFAVAPIVPDKGLVAQPPGGPSFLILVDRLSAADAASIGENHQLDGLKLTSVGQPADLVLKNPQGVMIGGLAWDARRPGRILRREAVPIVTIVSLCLALAGRRLLRRAQVALADARVAAEEAYRSRELASQQERDARLNLERTVAEIRTENGRLNAQADASRSFAMKEASQQFEAQIAPALQAIQANASALTSSAGAVRERVINLLASMEATTQLADDAAEHSSAVSPEALAFEGSAADIAREAEVGLSLARSGNDHGAQARSSLTGLTNALSSIDAVVDAIDGISRQTNFLALNAKIEAARSGVMGAGFSVVAGEVKALALQTAELTKAVAGKIADVRASATVAVTSIGQVSDALSSSEIAVDAITAAAGRQLAGSTLIREGVESIVVKSRDLTQSVQASRAIVAESRKDADDLEAMAHQLDGSLETLRLSAASFVTHLAAA